MIARLGRLFLALALALAFPAAARAADTFGPPEGGGDGDEPEAIEGGCGVERWKVKTLSDKDAGAINPHAVTDATIEDLIYNPAVTPWQPKQAPPDRRILEGNYDETAVYRIQGLVIAYKMEKDRDIHVILESENPEREHATMIIEMPDPTCRGARNFAYVKNFARVRRYFTEHVGSLRRSRRKSTANAHPEIARPEQLILPEKPVRVTVTGVRFFDHIHNQDGVAPNGVELHPILDIQRVEDAPDRPLSH